MDNTPSKNPDRFVETEIEDEIVLLRLSDGDMFSLTKTSREIWNCIDGQRTLSAIADELAARHEAPRDAVEADVARFVSELHDAGLVEFA